LGPTTPVGPQVQADNTLSSSLAGTEVLVNGIPCPLLYVSATQINAVAPYALFTKSSAVVSVRVFGIISDEVAMNVTASSPGLFAIPPTGIGVGAILNEDQSLNTAANPAAKGTVISLLVTGKARRRLKASMG